MNKADKRWRWWHFCSPLHLYMASSVYQCRYFLWGEANMDWSPPQRILAWTLLCASRVIDTWESFLNYWKYSLCLFWPISLHYYLKWSFIALECDFIHINISCFQWFNGYVVCKLGHIQHYLRKLFFQQVKLPEFSEVILEAGQV